MSVKELLAPPPIRTSLQEAPRDATRDGERTVREWYYFWSLSAGRINENTHDLETLITVGPHSERPDDAPDGALHIDSDRGNAIYQLQDGEWKLVAGMMYGTIISVDQRPAGLGLNDKGLVFVSKDSTSVIWNGTSWDAISRILDLGPTPQFSQLVLKAAGAGALALLASDAGTQEIAFGSERVGGASVARHAGCVSIVKDATRLHFRGSATNTPGSAPSLSSALTLDLANRYFGVGTETPVNGLDLRTAGFCVTGADNIPTGLGPALTIGNQTTHQRIQSWSNTPLALNPFGNNVGVKLANPNYSLDVSGDVNCSGVYRVNGTPISGGGVTTQSVVTGSRLINGTAYPNSTGKPMFVSVAAATTSGQITAFSDGGASPTTQVAAAGQSGGASVPIGLSFWVLPGNNYKVTAAGGAVTLQSWTEWT